MTDDVPRPLPQYVYQERTRHGRAVFYFRKGKGKRERVPAPGSPGFDDRYHALLAGLPRSEAPKRGTAGTLEWLIAQYQQSTAYGALAPSTRRLRDRILKKTVAKAGYMRIKGITARNIAKGRDERRATPGEAHNYIAAMRGLFKWAVDNEHLTRNPVIGVAELPQPEGDGFVPWTDADVEAYEARWPAGTRERVWLHVLLYTGLRKGDAVLLGRQHIRDGIATIKTEKTGTEVSIVIRPTLAATIAAGPCADLAFICGRRREPLTKESFGNAFKAACLAAGVKASAHGVRKLAASRSAEAGATERELMAMFGWEDPAMAAYYTRSAERKWLAKQGAEKMAAAEGNGNGDVPHLEHDRPAPRKMS